MTDHQRGVREVSRTLDNVESVAIESHQKLDELRKWSLATIDLLEHEYEYADLELESEGLANEIAQLMGLVHSLYRRLSQDERVALVPPFVIDQYEDGLHD